MNIINIMDINWEILHRLHHWLDYHEYEIDMPIAIILILTMTILFRKKSWKKCCLAFLLTFVICIFICYFFLSFLHPLPLGTEWKIYSMNLLKDSIHWSFFIIINLILWRLTMAFFYRVLPNKRAFVTVVCIMFLLYTFSFLEITIDLWYLWQFYKYGTPITVILILTMTILFREKSWKKFGIAFIIVTLAHYLAFSFLDAFSFMVIAWNIFSIDLLKDSIYWSFFILINLIIWRLIMAFFYKVIPNKDVLSAIVNIAFILTALFYIILFFCCVRIFSFIYFDFY